MHFLKHHHFLTLVLLVAFLPACSEDDGGEVAQPMVRVALAPDHVPAAGIKVVVMDPSTNTPAAVPVASDAAGECVFAGLGNGDYSLLVFGGAEHEVIDLGDTWNINWMSGSGFSVSEPLPPMPVVQVGLRRIPGGLPRISGRVVDASTGQPLAGAFVSTSPFLSGYVGGTTVKDDVTLADGLFSVSEIAFGQDPQSGNLVQIEPLLVTCAGYSSRSWRHEPANGDDNLDITGVMIALDPDSVSVTGSLTGRLLLAGDPVSGVRVGLGEVGGDKSGVGLPGYIAWTGPDGVFRFPGLPEGTYLVHPGFVAHDGFVYPNQAGNVARTVVSGLETAIGDLTLLNEVQLTYPPNGWEYLGPEWITELSWLAVPSAEQYAVYLDGSFLAETDTTMFDLPEDLPLDIGGHRWYVLAYDVDGLVIGATEVPGIFYIIPTP